MGLYMYRGQNQSVSPAAASASVTINTQARAIRLHNSGANICYVRIGTSTSGTPATSADTPVIAGEVLVVNKDEGEDTLSHISAAGTTLLIQPCKEF
jgi:hypothetical protein